MAFDLAAKLREAAEAAGRDQIEYLPYEQIDPDPDNFYSLEGLNELADSISTVGLLTPLRVRQTGERYTLTSGHRRRAAIKLLIDSGEDWSGGVPCIVDRGEREPEFDELRLIFANQQRVKTSAELSREAERVEELLCALRDKGFDFPGRMQEHVAQAMGVKAAKLKRLHAIRGRAHEYVLDAYDRGEINESVAYELSQAPQDLQKMILVRLRHAGRDPGELTAEQVERITDARIAMVNRGCHFNRSVRCAYVNVRLDEALRRRFAGSKVGNCQKGGCCHGCPALIDCESYCCKCEDERQGLQAAQETRRAALEKTAEKLAQVRARSLSEVEEECAAIWARIRAAAEASGVDLRKILGELCESCQDVEQALRFLCGAERDTGLAAELLAGDLKFLADRLDCTTDWLLGRAETPRPAREPEPVRGSAAAADPDRIEARWLDGAPEEPGRYMCLLRGPGAGAAEPDKEFRVDVREDGPYLFGRPMLRGYIITAHWPLPPLGDRAEEA